MVHHVAEAILSDKSRGVHLPIFRAPEHQFSYSRFLLSSGPTVLLYWEWQSVCKLKTWIEMQSSSLSILQGDLFLIVLSSEWCGGSQESCRNKERLSFFPKILEVYQTPSWLSCSSMTSIFWILHLFFSLVCCDVSPPCPFTVLKCKIVEGKTVFKNV